MKTATAMVAMKVETMIIGTKIVSVNVVLITIRLNPVARIKQNTILDSLQHSVPAIVFRVFLQ